MTAKYKCMTRGCGKEFDTEPEVKEVMVYGKKVLARVCPFCGDVWIGEIKVDENGREWVEM